MNPQEKNCCDTKNCCDIKDCCHKPRKVLKLVGILIAIYLVVLSIKELKSISYVGTDPTQSHTISVDGTGDAVAIPDIATLSFTVTETAKAVADAQTLATTKVNTTVAALKKSGVAEKDIQTTSYNINPHYEYQQSSVCSSNGICPPSNPVITGYDVSQSTNIKVRDLKKVGDLLTLIGSNGVQNVSGPSFSVDKPEATQAEARAIAIDQARSKANVLAKALGVRIVRVISFSESGNMPYPIRYDMGMGVSSSKALAVAPEISTGEQKITSNVTIVYEIE
ncbi:MAG: SIMPL domain-containing protein [Candidatus Taylorbacteria bacterium]